MALHVAGFLYSSALHIIAVTNVRADAGHSFWIKKYSVCIILKPLMQYLKGIVQNNSIFGPNTEGMACRQHESVKKKWDFFHLRATCWSKG